MEEILKILLFVALLNLKIIPYSKDQQVFNTNVTATKAAVVS